MYYTWNRFDLPSRQPVSSWTVKRVDSPNNVGWTSNSNGSSSSNGNAAAFANTSASSVPSRSAEYRRGSVDPSQIAALKQAQRERIRESLVNNGSGVVLAIDFETQLFGAEPATPSAVYTGSPLPTAHPQSRAAAHQPQLSVQTTQPSAKSFSTPAAPPGTGSTTRNTPASSAAAITTPKTSATTIPASAPAPTSTSRSQPPQTSSSKTSRAAPPAPAQPVATGGPAQPPIKIRCSLPRPVDSSDAAPSGNGASAAVMAANGSAPSRSRPSPSGDASRRSDYAPVGPPELQLCEPPAINAIFKEMIPSPLLTPIKDTDYRRTDSSSFKFPLEVSTASSRQAPPASSSDSVGSSRKSNESSGHLKSTIGSPDLAISPVGSRASSSHEPVDINGDLELSDDADSSSSDDDDDDDEDEDDDDDEHDAFNKQVNAVKFGIASTVATTSATVSTTKMGFAQPETKGASNQTVNSRPYNAPPVVSSQPAESKRPRATDVESNGFAAPKATAAREHKPSPPAPAPAPTPAPRASSQLSNVGLSRVQELEEKLKQNAMTTAHSSSSRSSKSRVPADPAPAASKPASTPSAGGSTSSTTGTTGDVSNHLPSSSTSSFDSDAWSLGALKALFSKPTNDEQAAEPVQTPAAPPPPVDEPTKVSSAEPVGLKLKLPNPKSSDSSKKRAPPAESNPKPPQSPHSRSKTDRPLPPSVKDEPRTDWPSFDDLPTKASVASPANSDDFAQPRKVKLETPTKTRPVDQKPALDSLAPAASSINSRNEYKLTPKSETVDVDMKPAVRGDSDAKQTNKRRKQHDTDVGVEEPSKRTRTEKAVASLEETLRYERAARASNTNVPTPLAAAKLPQATVSPAATPKAADSSDASAARKCRSLAVSFPLSVLSREQRERLIGGDRPRTPTTTFPKQPLRTRNAESECADTSSPAQRAPAARPSTKQAPVPSSVTGCVLSAQAAAAYERALTSNAFVTLQNGGDVRNLMASPDELLRRLASPETLHSSGRELKHAADAIRDNHLQRVVTYLRSVLEYVSSLCAMEFHDANLAQHRFSMCFDMTGLVKHVRTLIEDLKNKRVVATRDAPPNSAASESLARKMLRVLSVVCARLQAGLHFKMYSLKKDDVARTRCAIDEYKSISSLPASNELFRHTHASPGGVALPSLAAAAARGTAFGSSLQHVNATAAALAANNGGSTASSQSLSARSTTPDYGLNASPASPYRHNASPAQIEQYLFVNAAAGAASVEPTGVLSSGAVCSSASSVASSASSGYASSAGCGLPPAGAVVGPSSASPQNGAAPAAAATVTIAAVLNSMMDRYVSLTNHLVLAHSFFDDAEKRCFELLEDARGTDQYLDRFVALATQPLPLEAHPLVLAEYARAALDFVAAVYGWPMAVGNAATHA